MRPMSEINIESGSAVAVNVPMNRPLVTGGGTVSSAPLVLIKLQGGGVEGVSYIFGYTPVALPALHRVTAHLIEDLKGEAARPLEVFQALRRRFRLLGNQGLVAMACAGIDMALWDMAAKSAGLPLYRLLGAGPGSIPAYNSNGLGIIGPDAAVAEARELLEPGFSAVKLRLGYATAGEDLAVVEAVREAVGDDVTLMADYNQSLGVAETEQRMRMLDDAGLHWLEERTRAEDHAGHARIRQSIRTPVQLGENCWGPAEMQRIIERGACDYFMADAVKIGGVTGWQHAAALGASQGVPLSSHLFPEISAHLLAATPGAHWLEYVDWAEPVLDTPVTIDRGRAAPADQPGIGVAFNEDSVARYSTGD